VSEVHITPLDHESRNMAPPREPSTPSSQQSSTSRDSGSSVPSSSLQTPQTPRTPQTPNTPREPDIFKPLRTSSSPECKEKSTYTLRSGFLTIPESGQQEIYITSIIDTTVQDNFISIKQATELGLHRQDLEQQDLDYIQQENWSSSAKIVGKVLGLRWRRREWSKSIPVDLWVEERYPQTGEHMVLGKAFIRAVRRQEQIGQ
jgi:hypothetical protein